MIEKRAYTYNSQQFPAEMNTKIMIRGNIID